MLSACNINDTNIFDKSVTQDSSNSMKVSSQQDQPSAQKGLTAFIDPATGELTSKPSADNMKKLQAASQAQLKSMNQAQFQQPLIKQRMADGSVKVDLQGRFHSNLTATIDDNNKLKIEHQKPSLSPKLQNKHKLQN